MFAVVGFGFVCSWLLFRCRDRMRHHLAHHLWNAYLDPGQSQPGTRSSGEQHQSPLPGPASVRGRQGSFRRRGSRTSYRRAMTSDLSLEKPEPTRQRSQQHRKRKKQEAHHSAPTPAHHSRSYKAAQRVRRHGLARPQGPRQTSGSCCLAPKSLCFVW